MVVVDIVCSPLKRADSETALLKQVDSTLEIEALRQNGWRRVKGKLLVGEKVAAAIGGAVM
jgi:hypothetical protein